MTRRTYQVVVEYPRPEDIREAIRRLTERYPFAMVDDVLIIGTKAMGEELVAIARRRRHITEDPR